MRKLTLYPLFILLISSLTLSCSENSNNSSDSPSTNTPENNTTANNTSNSSYWIDYATTWTKGSGTQANPYQIETAEQLAYIAKMVNDTTYKKYGGTRITYLNTYFKLMNNIDLSGKIWTPIGGLNESAAYFTGKLDGNGKTISNIDIRESNRNYVGLFGNTQGATISNLDLISGTVNGQNYAGGIVGHMQTTTLSNCHNGATVIGIDYVGGICGSCSSSTITIAYNTGSISGTLDVGGITGELTSAEASGTPTITQSYNNATVSASDKLAGGLVGYSYGGSNVISFCYNKGTVSAASICAGIAGSMASGRIQYSYNIGTFSAKDGKAAPIRTTNSGLGSTSESSVYYLSTDVDSDYQKYYSGQAQLTTTLKSSSTISYLNTSNSYWKIDASNINNGYPILSWQ